MKTRNFTQPRQPLSMNLDFTKKELSTNVKILQKEGFSVDDL